MGRRCLRMTHYQIYIVLIITQSHCWWLHGYGMHFFFQEYINIIQCVFLYKCYSIWKVRVHNCVAHKLLNVRRKKKSNKIRSKATKKWYLGQAESLHSPTHPTSLLIIKRSKKLNVPDMCSLFFLTSAKKVHFWPIHQMLSTFSVKWL